MRLLSNLILIIFICLSIGCYQYSGADNHIVFATPFGPVVKGDSMRDVINRLGNPIDVSHYQRKEIWRYNFDKTGEVFVYFENGDVTDMLFSNKPKACNKCKGGN